MFVNNVSIDSVEYKVSDEMESEENGRDFGAAGYLVCDSESTC